MDAQPASSQTAYRWSFANKGDRSDKAALEAARKAVGTATNSKAPEMDRHMIDEVLPLEDPHVKPNRVLGPSLPSGSDRVLMREAEEEERASERAYDRKRVREVEKDRAEDMFGPKEQGRDGMLEKKKARREADRSFRDEKDDALGDYDDNTLLGGGDSFQARLVTRVHGKKNNC